MKQVKLVFAGLAIRIDKDAVALLVGQVTAVTVFKVTIKQ
jgi:hypothetical protein